MAKTASNKNTKTSTARSNGAKKPASKRSLPPVSTAAASRARTRGASTKASVSSRVKTAKPKSSGRPVGDAHITDTGVRNTLTGELISRPRSSGRPVGDAHITSTGVRDTLTGERINRKR